MEERENSPTADLATTSITSDASTVSSGVPVDNSNSGGSWSWGSFLQKATTDLVGKSAAMVEFMKRDLNEFSATMQKDTTIIMNDATQSLKEKITREEANKAASLVKSGITSFFGSINASLALFEDQGEESATSQQAYQTRSQARLAALQADLSTFKKEPPGRPEEFEAWLISFDVNKHRAEMDSVLDSADAVQEAYNQLVPSVVTHNEFWQRYFYRVHQLEKEDRRIQSMMARSGERSPDDMDWGDDIDDPASLSQSLLMDPSEVSSVVSNESFQMVHNEPVTVRDVGDTVVVGDSPESSPVKHHKKKESSSSSLGEWDNYEDPAEPNPSRDETPTRD